MNRIIPYLICLFLVFTASCTTETVYVERPSQPPKPVDSRQPTAWSVKSHEFSRPRFSLTTTVIPKGKKLEIKGRVIESECLLVIGKSRDVPEQRYSPSSSQWVQEWRTETRKLTPVTYKWSITSLHIQNPYGKDTVVPVKEDGTFNSTLYLNGTFYFEKPELTRYLQANRVKARSAFVVPNGLPAGLSISMEIPLPDIFEIGIKRHLVQKYVTDRIADFTIVCYDQDTRKPITPLLSVIAGDGPTKEDIIELLSKEFRGNQELVRVGLHTAEGVMLKEDKTTGITQEMNFKVWVGASLKLSAIHPEYYFFKTTLDVQKAGKIRKNILLIEKGKMSRVNNFKEGRGMIVDQ